MFSSEAQRKLQPLTWAQNQVITRELPRDTILKQLVLRLSGTTVATFSTAPVIRATASFDCIVPLIQVIINGSRVVKSVRPWLLHMEELLVSGFLNERKSSSANGAAAYANNPTAESGFDPGTTTYTTTVAETVVLNFAMILSKIGRESTYLNLKGVSSAELRMNCGAETAIEVYNGYIAFTSTALTIEITTIEAPGIPAETRFSDWRQTTKVIQFTAQVTEYAIDINRGNYLAGIKLFLEQDVTPAAAATGFVPKSNTVTDLKLVLNGNRIIKATTFTQLQAENRARFGVNAPFASNLSKMDGFAYLDFLNDGDLRTVLDCKPPKTDNVQLIVSTRAAAATNNVYPHNLTIETGEIVRFS